jgi:hypothetical protein
MKNAAKAPDYCSWDKQDKPGLAQQVLKTQSGMKKACKLAGHFSLGSYSVIFPLHSFAIEEILGFFGIIGIDILPNFYSS